MLCVYNSKSDPRPTWYLGLGGDQCIGCRVTIAADRQHCLELVLSDAPSWLLSAATETEISDWRHSFCLAVSTGVEVSQGWDAFFFFSRQVVFGCSVINFSLDHRIGSIFWSLFALWRCPLAVLFGMGFF